MTLRHNWSRHRVLIIVQAFNLPFGCRKNGRKSNRQDLGAKIYSRSMGDSVALAMAGIFIA
ncbi:MULTISPECIES: hypothetical protein [Thalassospira]|uniref:hypothetical protein n=1 Tax=Thalassospira TaxID=168934 RepID=UPI0007A62547|nr:MULTISPECIES: hypothetical protein [Thalassospira]MBL4843168.1 hypothetical protein [Thalassospira sp.]MBR9817595.1 hypothetical protein [Rhodospirillales bacterium]KZD08105.1 hypothetical protein AUP45_17700 [Thalassospira xiamenensis]MCD1593892.1 hypothetical protein [Thalassospira xiamenensis]QPL37639.1 hypothetical protein IT971_10245 [Thalassospira sp. B30-1]